MSFFQSVKERFTSERISALLSATILVLASVFNFPSFIVWIVGIVAWLGLSMLGVLFAGVILTAQIRPTAVVRYYVSIAESEAKRGKDVLGQLLDNVPPLVTICAWISLSWHVTAIAVFLGWVGVKYTQYRAIQIVNELSDEAVVKILEDDD